MKHKKNLFSDEYLTIKAFDKITKKNIKSYIKDHQKDIVRLIYNLIHSSIDKNFYDLPQRKGRLIFNYVKEKVVVELVSFKEHNMQDQFTSLLGDVFDELVQDSLTKDILSDRYVNEGAMGTESLDKLLLDS